MGTMNCMCLYKTKIRRVLQYESQASDSDTIHELIQTGLAESGLKLPVTAGP